MDSYLVLSPHLTKILHQEMTRKDFLRLGAISVASIVGITGVITELLSHAATPYSASEAENGTFSVDVMKETNAAPPNYLEALASP
jgi:hypothetical protein